MKSPPTASSGSTSGNAITHITDIFHAKSNSLPMGMFERDTRACRKSIICARILPLKISNGHFFIVVMRAGQVAGGVLLGRADVDQVELPPAVHLGP